MKLRMLRRACNKLPACRLLPTRRRGVGRAGGGEGTQATNAVVSADHKQRYNMADCWFGQRAVIGVKSGERGDHSILPHPPIQRFGNVCPRKALTWRE